MFTAALLYLLLRKFFREQYNKLQLFQEKNKRLEKIAWLQSHVIRAPLANLMGCVSLVSCPESLTDEEFQQLCGDIAKCAVNLDNVIREITATAETD